MSKTVDIYRSMTYNEYLDTWESFYGDADEVETTVYVYGIEVTIQIPKLSMDKFTKHRDEIARLVAEFEKASAEGDDVAMDNIISDMFPHEVALLL